MEQYWHVLLVRIIIIIINTAQYLIFRSRNLYYLFLISFYRYHITFVFMDSSLVIFDCETKMDF